MSAERDKVERLIAMAERLISAIEADIAALKAGKPREMKTLDPEIQRLSVLYGREAMGLDPKSAPKDLRGKFFATTGRFRDILALHARLLTRMRNASEGIVKAVAEEVERRRAPLTNYAPVATRPRPPVGAMIYNRVV
jgi:hypothetical protein